MNDSLHMYHNARVYEGKEVTPATCLTRNNYSRGGYEFDGWNTQPDGSGVSYGDGAEILDLASGEGEVVTLYAQWKVSRSMLRMDLAGGSYGGSAGPFEVVQDYASSFVMPNNSVVPPQGYRIKFEENGGNPVSDITGTMYFKEWILSYPFMGKFQNNVYFFTAPDGNVDTVTAVYAPAAVKLPEAERKGFSFGGWYYDEAFERPAGKAGDAIVPVRDMTLYAQWVELKLVSRDNHIANMGKGAVDLTWSQPDGKDKIYKVYQSVDEKNWYPVTETGDMRVWDNKEFPYFYTGGEQSFTVTASGKYTLTLKGAQGADYGTHKGGGGGVVSADIWLEKGEVLSLFIGGRNGYQGGGAATVYGNGGGCTRIVSSQKGLLFVAGGGGGASEYSDGGAGGSSAGLTHTETGQSGVSGGGGGYRGGLAGEYIRHNHSESSACYHRHTGDSENGGGCYTVEDKKTKLCSPYRVLLNERKHFYNYDCGCTWRIYYHYVVSCDGTGHNHGSVTNYFIGDHCSNTNMEGMSTVPQPYVVRAYALGCGMREGYNCGYTNGQIIRSGPSYGGSSYANTDYAVNYNMQAGKNQGNGSVTIRPVEVGFLSELSMEGVAAPDLAGPETISANIKMEALGGQKLKILWEEPADNGTEYFHMVQSHMRQLKEPLCRSNITCNILASGVAGYYYLTDYSPDTGVTKSNGTYTKECSAIVEPDVKDPKGTCYFHVAAVDAAGNIGGSAHIPVKYTGAAWPLYTDPLEIETGENVHAAGKGVYFVRSDGVTPFMLRYRAHIDGYCSDYYQINYVIFRSEYNSQSAGDMIYVPSCPIVQDEISIESNQLSFFQEGDSKILRYPYSVLERRNGNRDIIAEQKFLLEPEMSGKKIKVAPGAGADWEGDIVFSESQRDGGNGIVLFADSQAPVINGMEQMRDMSLIDRNQKTVTLKVSASDGLSGIRDFCVTIRNSDNAIEKVYRSEDGDCITVEITETEPVFCGDFSVMAYAVDNVGNETQIEYATTEFALEAKVERMIEPHTPVFKNGESGILTFSVWGYADRVEVEFPQEMTDENPELNRTYSYADAPSYLQKEEIQFMIPLYTPQNGSYEITVRAYKGDKKLEEHPVVGVVQVEGSVLDELRTRLR